MVTAMSITATKFQFKKADFFMDSVYFLFSII